MERATRQIVYLRAAICALLVLFAAQVNSQSRYRPDSVRLADLEAQVAALQSKLAHVTATNTEVTFSGVNVRVTNGTGRTDTKNGLGNLIVGYNESRGAAGTDVRSGSHNLVLGVNQNYLGFSGIVAGVWNQTDGWFSSVLGGTHNRAEGYWTTVVGGMSNATRDGGTGAVVAGGSGNTASAWCSAIGGGQGWEAREQYQWIAGD